MKAFTLMLIAVALAAIAPLCLARTHTVRVQQELPAPGDTYQNFGLQVAIDGDSIVALADRDGGRSALLYRRGANGRWTFSRVLLDVTAAPTALRDQLVMKNGIAAIQLADQLHVFQRQVGDWAEAQIAADARTPTGTVAISGRRIAVGLNACLDDALLLEEAAAGSWAVTGRVTGPPLTCGSRPVTLDLNESRLLVRRNATEVHVYSRNLQEFDWVRVGGFDLPAAVSSGFGPVVLQKTVAVAPGSAVFRGNGGLWNSAGFARPVDYANGAGFAYQVVFRDGVLITRENWGEIHANIKPYVYLDNGTSFEHVAILESYGFTDDFDVSGRTVVAGSDDFGARYVTVFTLPAPLAAQRAIANDFEARDLSGFQQTGGGTFLLAQIGPNDVLRQTGRVNEAHAILTGSDWNDYQSIEADITPTEAVQNDRWVGLGLRYVDEGNFYYVAWRSSNVLELKRKVNGVITTLAQTTLPFTLGQRQRVKLAADRDFITVRVNGSQVLYKTDASLKRGKGALMAYRVLADFDNVYAAPTAPLNLAWKNYFEAWFDWGRDFDFSGGNWQLTGDADPDGLSQTTTSGAAYALVGSATDEQSVVSLARLDTFNGTASQAAWFGLFARHVDASNYYQMSVRSANTLQIRKVVNGQLTVLASVPFTATPGAFHELRFDVLGNQLHALVDGVRVAQAIDGSLARGRYGIGTYRTAATFQTFVVDQP